MNLSLFGTARSAEKSSLGRGSVQTALLGLSARRSIRATNAAKNDALAAYPAITVQVIHRSNDNGLDLAQGTLQRQAFDCHG